MKHLLVVFAFAAFASGCSCGPNVIRDDGGTVEDAGVDAGAGDAGTGGGSADAGPVDAGPPPVLKVKRLLPPRGASAGGTTVLVEGSGFIKNFSNRGTEAKKVTTLKIGGNQVVDYTIIDDETLELRTPPGNAGAATVLLTNPLGTFNCNSCFTYFDELVVTKLSPAQGPLAGGNEVVIDGQGFTSDVEVLFGSASAVSISLVSSKQLKVVAPRGALADLVDVTVYNKNGVGVLRRAYRYLGEVRIFGLTPKTGPVAGGTVVTLTGSGFTGATEVKFGANAATALTVANDSQLTVTTPAASSTGAVAVTVTSPGGSWTAQSAFAYVDPAGPFALFGVFPHVARPGDTVTLLGQGLDTAGLTASLGGQSATVGAQTFSTAELTVPARGSAPRKSDVVVNTATLPGAFTWKLDVAAIAPNAGPAAGGTMASVSGTAFPPDAKVFIGALEATVGSVSETALPVTTPKGSGGLGSDVRVFEAADPENEDTLTAGFTYEQPLSIGRVQPERGAIAGNTLVTVLGAGFKDGVTVAFGTSKAKDVKVIDSHTLTCRTPRGNVGVVDVEVQFLTVKDLLPGGFSYFDPRSISGGLSGGPLTGTLNITVLDSTQGFYGAPVPLANAILGTDPNTPFQGVTDARGQVTFSDASLVKAQVATIYKEGYQSATVTNITAENLTVFIQRTGGGDGNPGPPPPGVPASIISGRVTGFKLPRALTPDEVLEARVFVTQTSLFSGPPLGGLPDKSKEKWQVVKEGGEYLVYTGAGLRAVYAILGISHTVTGQFTPYLMGIKRGITTSPDNPAVNQDIILDSHLDVTVPITIDSPLSFPGQFGMEPGTNTIYAWLDLGAEGFIPHPHNWATGKASVSSVSSVNSMLSFPNFPRLDGSNFIFLNESSGAAPYPVSYYFRRQPGLLTNGVTIGPMLAAPKLTAPLTQFNGTISWVLGTGAVPDIHQVDVVKPTLLGLLTLWTVVLPGNETQVTLPAPAVTKLRNEETGPLYVVMYSSRSPKFNYNQWTYESLSGVSWSSFTLNLSEGFTP